MKELYKLSVGLSHVSDVYNKAVELAKRRGIFWPSYEIYGGIAGLYDIGPVGTMIKNKIVSLWRKYFVESTMGMVVEVETPMITPEKVFEASGHLKNFTDPVVQCSKCKKVFRADHLVEEILHKNVESLSLSQLDSVIKENGIKCPSCGGDLGEVRYFNLLFETTIGPYTGERGFLRPETAQGMFTAFKRVFESYRQRLPLGIAQIGRVARNEISPRQGLVRMREFSIMEVEFFMDPKETDVPLADLENDKVKILRAQTKEAGREELDIFTVKELVSEKVVVHPWMAYWMAKASRFVNSLGINEFFFEEKLPQERAHYSKQTFDQIAIVGGEKVEISGHAYRGDYDLSGHSRISGQDLTVFKKYDTPQIVKKKTVLINKQKISSLKDVGKEIMKKISGLNAEQIEELIRQDFRVDSVPISSVVSITEREEKVNGEKFFPHVVEPSFGVERSLYLVVVNSYKEKKDRIILSLPKDIAPYDVAVFPLLEREEIIKKAKQIRDLLQAKYTVLYDESGSIGKRYARADEIGIPFDITVDPQSLDDASVTIRDRDTWEQSRVKVDSLVCSLEKLFNGTKLNSIGEKADNNE